jgi:archaellum biogenesis ATPase FlaH
VKVVIRGDRETGKSALLRRLEGGPFIEQHIETPEIQTAHVYYSFISSLGHF